MDASDRAEFVRQAGDRYLPTEGTFLSATAVKRWESLIASGPAKIERLQRFRRAVYWVFPKHRSLTQLPFYLAEAAPHFDLSQSWSLAMLIDLSWMYLLSVLFAVDEVTRLHLSDSNTALRRVLLGGELEMREKEDFKRHLRRVIEQLAPDPRDRPDEPDIVPAFFGDLADLVAKFDRGTPGSGVHRDRDRCQPRSCVGKRIPIKRLVRAQTRFRCSALPLPRVAAGFKVCRPC